MGEIEEFVKKRKGRFYFQFAELWDQIEKGKASFIFQFVWNRILICENQRASCCSMYA
jgi:hypothetical protein